MLHKDTLGGGPRPPLQGPKPCRQAARFRQKPKEPPRVRMAASRHELRAPLRAPEVESSRKKGAQCQGRATPNWLGQRTASRDRFAPTSSNDQPLPVLAAKRRERRGQSMARPQRTRPSGSAGVVTGRTVVSASKQVGQFGVCARLTLAESWNSAARTLPEPIAIEAPISPMARRDKERLMRMRDEDCADDDCADKAISSRRPRGWPSAELTDNTCKELFAGAQSFVTRRLQFRADRRWILIPPR